MSLHIAHEIRCVCDTRTMSTKQVGATQKSAKTVYTPVLLSIALKSNSPQLNRILTRSASPNIFFQILSNNVSLYQRHWKIN